MKKRALRILAGSLILSLCFMHSASVFADDTASSTPADATVVEQPQEQNLATSSESADVASSTPEIESAASSTDPIATSTDVTGITATSTNAATTTNDVSSEASTGDNTATSTTGTTTIATGDAIATANVMNVVNVNLFNSEALFAFLNKLGSGDGDIDLRNLIAGYDGNLGCTQCSVSTSSLPSTVAATTSNDATISNTVIVRSSTGDNTATSTDGSSIQTGNAYANANVVNVVNTNFTDSRYVMIVLNSFGNLGGDIVLPNASFFDSFLKQTSTSNSTNPTSISNDNTANVDSQVTSHASTGDNTSTASSTGATVNTGNAVSGSTVVNTVNQNVLGGNQIALIFHVYGNWSGKAFNIPDGLTWHGLPVQIEMYSDNGVPMGDTNTSLSNTNNATIQNNISVSASTGNNSVGGGNGSIHTGNAYTNANIINIANSNVVGRNWVSAIINIFGDWTGNLSFGQPNLWVGTRASFANNYHGPDAQLTYTYTIKNNGDAPAHHVVLTHDIGSSFITHTDSDNGSWNIGTLMPGQTVEVVHSGKAASVIPWGDTSVSNTVTVKADETDSNTQDNTDVLNTVLSLMTGQININTNPVTQGIPANFSITKTNSAHGPITASSSVDYTISIKNLGGKANHALLFDAIKDEQGNVIHTEQWDLGAVQSQEEITVSYTALFGASSTLGVYTNNAYIHSVDGDFPDSAIASSPITISQLTLPPADLLTKSLTTFTKPLKAEAYSKKETHQDDATTTSTSTPIVASINDLFVPPKSGLVANAFSALGAQYWYWYVLILSGAGYLLIQQRRWS